MFFKLGLRLSQHTPRKHMLDHLDRAPTLPIEVIEQVVDFLQDDTCALTTCSLACRALLPVARKHIWSTVRIPVLRGREPNPHRLSGFLALLDADPDIQPFVRSFSWEWASSIGFKPSWSRFIELRLWERLPNLRALKFDRISFSYIDSILQLCHAIPRLEELVFGGVSVIPTGSLSLSSSISAKDVDPTRGTSKLKCFSIRGPMTPGHISAVAEALLQEKLYASLEVLDLRCVGRMIAAPPGPGGTPSADALSLLITEIAPNLRTCAVPIYAVEYSAENVARLYDGVTRCRNLRSLTVQCDISPDPNTRQTLHNTPFLFVEALADRLSRRGNPPLPHLEELSMCWSQTQRNPPGCREAFKYLALALVGDRSRYPALRRLEVRRTVALKVMEQGGPGSLDPSQEMLRQALAVVEDAGVQLVVST